MSIVDGYILVFQFALKHSLTKKTFEELLSLLAAHLPHGGVVRTSIYKLKKLFMDIFSDTTASTHYYCMGCGGLRESSTDTACCEAEFGDFTYLPIASQLKRKLEGKIAQL